MSPNKISQRPAWQIAAGLKLSNLQCDAQAQREVARAAHDQTIALHTQIVKLTERQKELVAARSGKAENDPVAVQISTQIADGAAELDALDAGIAAARERYTRASQEANVANGLASAAAKAFSVINRTAGNANGGHTPGFSGTTVSGA